MEHVNAPTDLDSHNMRSTQRELELRGFVNFPSAGSVIDYLLIRDFHQIDTVCVVEAHGENNMARVNAGLPEANLVIPTITGGYIMAALPENSPHAGHVAEYLEMVAEHVADAVQSAAAMGFGEWWLSIGNRFFVQNLDILDDVEVDNDIEMENTALQNPAQIGVQDPHHQNTALQKTKAANGDYGMYKFHSFSTGTLRIWTETGVITTAGFLDEHLSHHPIFSNAPAFNADLRLLDDIFVTDEELLTWFPDHLVYWPDCLRRLYGAGWTSMSMSSLMFAARGVATISTVDNAMFTRDRSRISHFRHALGLPIEGALPTTLPYTDLTCANWQEPRGMRAPLNRLRDYYVSDLVNGVLPNMFPSGDKSGPLTVAIGIARDLPNDPEILALKLSGLSTFLKKHNIIEDLKPAGQQIPSIVFHSPT